MAKDCDIIIPVWNQPHFTRDCVDSIREGTSTAYRIIMIDNASDAPTKKYLEGMKAVDVVIIRNERNLGFVKAVNQGIQASDARYICILNNDTLVTKGWLEEMISIAQSRDDIGIVNPSSNNLGQRPEKGETIAHYAERIRPQTGRSVELGAAIGFCMLIKRGVIERIGIFDEIYGMGNFEDTDFSRRASKEGFRSVRACGAYVYHRENTSFRTRETFDEEFRRNRDIYEFRWGRPMRIAYLLDACDEYALKKIWADSLKAARDGNWVFIYSKGRRSVPAHSNIIYRELPGKLFRLHALWYVVTKKKKFGTVIVRDEGFGRLLSLFGFMHHARISYY